jgi:hypothetical protein
LEGLVYSASLLIGLFAFNEISYSSKKKKKKERKKYLCLVKQMGVGLSHNIEF